MQEFKDNLTATLDHIIDSIPVFYPELILIIGFLVVLLSTIFVDKIWKHSSLILTLLTVVCSFFALQKQFLVGTQSGFFGMISIDHFAINARSLILITLIAIIILIQPYAQKTPVKKSFGDIYSLLLVATIGMQLLTMTTNWLMLFIAIETISISSYILVGFFSATNKQAEAAMKYTLFGAVCSAIMLYGLSLIYGFTGNLDFTNISHIQGLIAAPQTMISIALLFLFVGIGFKLGFVPFHLWTPDVYEGAPTPITAFLSTLPKIAAIVLVSRLFNAWTDSLFFFSELTFLLISIVAIVTMLVGNLIALRQYNLKRMMAYSSIGHTGFLLMAVISNTTTDPKIVLFYLTAYSIMNVGMFALIDSIELHFQSTDLRDYIGLGRVYPLLFASMTLLGVALVGLPPTAGFIGKLLVFTSTFELYQLQQDTILLLLLIVGALTTVISLFYYFKIPLYSFLKKEVTGNIYHPYPWSASYCIGLICTLAVLVLGIFPDILLNLFK